MTISAQPTNGLSYDPSEAKYWDEAGLRAEVERAFELCNSCRMCFKYCDSFPDLFKLLDEKHAGDPRKVSVEETDRVMDQCFQCKLCEVECPYTPRIGHAFNLDFPELVHRYKAVRAKKRGIKLRERVLGDPDLAGRMARMSFGMANTMNRVAAHRWFMEKVLGVHRDKLLPDFASETFEAWAASTGRVRAAGAGDEAVLFPTCYVQNNEPQIGRDALEVLDRNSVPTACAKGLACCGMPAWESGNLDEARRRAEHNLDILEPYVDAGAKVLAINPTCSMTMREKWPKWFEGALRTRARKVADAVKDPCDHLWSIREEPRFQKEVASKPASIAYHAPCHLRVQRTGLRARDLFRRIFGAPITPVMECCGHDGTYAMKVEGFEPSQRAGANSFRDMRAADAQAWSTDCPLAAIQFQQHAGAKPMHPLTILAKAYRGESFDGSVKPT
jgi:Fe-S oxidoreductase